MRSGINRFDGKFYFKLMARRTLCLKKLRLSKSASLPFEQSVDELVSIYQRIVIHLPTIWKELLQVINRRLCKTLFQSHCNFPRSGKIKLDIFKYFWCATLSVQSLVNRFFVGNEFILRISNSPKKRMYGAKISSRVVLPIRLL